MSIEDESVIKRRLDNSDPDGAGGAPLQNIIEKLVNSQMYAVLCTQGEGQPYGSLVAFAFSDDLVLHVQLIF